jgi:hypothetical protein
MQDIYNIKTDTWRAIGLSKNVNGFFLRQ